jgi:hypothetical protein
MSVANRLTALSEAHEGQFVRPSTRSEGSSWRTLRTSMTAVSDLWLSTLAHRVARHKLSCREPLRTDKASAFPTNLSLLLTSYSETTWYSGDVAIAPYGQGCASAPLQKMIRTTKKTHYMSIVNASLPLYCPYALSPHVMPALLCDSAIP